MSRALRRQGDSDKMRVPAGTARFEPPCLGFAPKRPQGPALPMTNLVRRPQSISCGMKEQLHLANVLVQAELSSNCGDEPHVQRDSAKPAPPRC